VIGTIELVGLLAQKLGAQGAFWAWWKNIDINTLGLIIVGMFVATWAIALVIWRVGRIEERWSSHLSEGEAAR
jgi:high-affinity nickel-transport protein